MLLKQNKSIKGYIGRLCNNNKQRITHFFSNPLANLRFLVVYQDEDKVKVSTFLDDLRKILIQQKEMLSFSEEMPLCEIPSLGSYNVRLQNYFHFKQLLKHYLISLGNLLKLMLLKVNKLRYYCFFSNLLYCRGDL